jgi:hypothetical protein
LTSSFCGTTWCSSRSLRAQTKKMSTHLKSQVRVFYPEQNSQRLRTDKAGLKEIADAYRVCEGSL